MEVKNKEIRATQSQLIQSEKMASMGELTAGIAHEIQNPLNFVNNFSEVSNELLDEMKAELAKGKSKSEFVIYPDAGHGFHADYRPGYNKADAQDGWKRLQEWFRKNGAA